MNEVNLSERAQRLLEVNEIIIKLDPTIRVAAFDLLRDYVVALKPRRESGSDGSGTTQDGIEEFFLDRVEGRPADNVLAVSAYYYGQFGSAAFEKETIETIGTAVGWTLPARVDKTLVTARRDGKQLFQVVGKGKFKPTVSGELFLKTEFSVVKGTRTPQADRTSSESSDNGN